MDQRTSVAYEAAAAALAREWHEQPAPSDLHALIRRYFRLGKTADVGCGSGREVAWLAASGFPARGFDPSDALLAQARSRYPGLAFEAAALPALAGIADGAFDNVLCETVVMHLPQEMIAPSVRRMLAILRPGGMLYLSWRVTRTFDHRDSHGRLYTAFDANLVRDALGDATLLLDEEIVSASSGKPIHRIVARRAECA